MYWQRGCVVCWTIRQCSDHIHTTVPPPLLLHAVLSSFPMESFLGLLQDFCLHVCLTCNQSCGDSADGHSSFQDRKQHTHLLRQPDRSDDMREKSLCRLYHSHSVVSAILSAKQLVSSGKKGSAGPGSSIMTKITLSKEDNSGML